MTEVTFKGSSIHTKGSLPNVGEKAFDFELVDNDLNTKTLKDYEGIKILYTAPSLDTGVCAASTKKFNEIAAKLPNVTILTITADLPFAQKRFCQSEKIKKVYTLSVMRSKSFGEDYGVLMVDGPLKGLLARSLVVLDDKNQIIYTELVPEITQEPDYEKALAALKG